MFQTKDPIDMAHFVRMRNSFTDNFVNVIRFNSLETDNEKVDYVLEVVKNTESEIFRNMVFKIKEFKSNIESEHLRKEGNKLFTEKKYQKALIFYSKSLSFATYKSDSMAMAYGNRAMLLFHKKYYKECLEDIFRAFECDCPPALRIVLSTKLCYSEKCIRGEKYQKSVNFCSFFPVILNEHPTINAASDAVDIKLENRFGRAVVATKDLKVGEVLSIEKPYSIQIKESSKYFHCEECLAVCFNLIPCKYCTSVLYCSETCKETAYNKHHKYGCDIPMIEEIDFFFLKIFVIIQNEENCFYFDDEYRSDRSEEILNLFADERRLGLGRIGAAMLAGIAFYILKHRTLFFMQHKISEKTTKALLYQLVIKILLNKIINYKRTNVFAFEELATGIFSFSSLYNHSCAPNCVATFHRDAMVVRAMGNIKQGEQCTISYLVNYDATCLDDRLVILLQKFYFRCNCVACEDEWPILERSTGRKPAYWNFLPRKIANKIAYDEYINKNQTEEQIIEEVTKEFESLLNVFSSTPPVETRLLLVHTLRKVFYHCGNKIFQF